MEAMAFAKCFKWFILPEGTMKKNILDYPPILDYQPILDSQKNLRFSCTSIIWLVVGPPLWKIWKSVGMMTFPIYGKIKNVPNHQPVIILHLFVVFYYCFTRGTTPLRLQAKAPALRSSPGFPSSGCPHSWMVSLHGKSCSKRLICGGFPYSRKPFIFDSGIVSDLFCSWSCCSVSCTWSFTMQIWGACRWPNFEYPSLFNTQMPIPKISFPVGTEKEEKTAQSRGKNNK